MFSCCHCRCHNCHYCWCCCTSSILTQDTGNHGKGLVTVNNSSDHQRVRAVRHDMTQAREHGRPHSLAHALQLSPSTSLGRHLSWSKRNRAAPNGTEKEKEGRKGRGRGEEIRLPLEHDTYLILLTSSSHAAVTISKIKHLSKYQKFKPSKIQNSKI